MRKSQLNKLSELQRKVYERTGLLVEEVGELTADKIKIRAMSIVNRENPEWGTWGVMDKREFEGSVWYEILGNSGTTILFPSDFHRYVVVNHVYKI
jgi:hypothetical protein